MDGSRSPDSDARIARALVALGGSATLGDLMFVAGLPRQDVERALDRLMAAERVQVTVSESAVLVYRLDDRGGEPPQAKRPSPGRWLRHRGRSPRSGPRPARFDRKTLQLIRARDGVISVAELIEHTGLPLRRATEEMHRLAALYGGEAHVSWDGHVVHAFPELMRSARDGFQLREPRPAWVRSNDPMRTSRRSRRREAVGLAVGGVGFIGSVATAWTALAWSGFEPVSGALGLVLASSAAGVFLCGRALLGAIARTRPYRYRRSATLRRYALGYVYETALKGKGVVSLDRTVEVLQARAGKRKVSRAAVRRALGQLAREFDAPITTLGRDVFFGFRSVKRQFLASQVQRTRLSLGRTAGGGTVFDSGDSPMAATRRELEAFDRALSQDASLQAG